jgi:sugar phosphate isomerase/epimerase
MTHPLRASDLVLCSGTVRKASFEMTAVAAAQAGFQGISLYYDEYQAARARGWSDRDLRSFLNDHGLSVAELDGPMSWLPGDASGPSAEEFITVAGMLGARSITVLEVRGRRVGHHIPLSHAALAFAAVCDLAAAHDLLAHIEYFPLSGIADFRTAYDIACQADRPNGGVMLDSWHHLRGPDAGLLDPDLPGTSILAVQLGDITTSPPADLAHEMMHGRLLPGTGAGELATLVRTLRARGCTAPMEVEVYSDELVARGPFAAARHAMEALQNVVGDTRSSPPEPTSR